MEYELCNLNFKKDNYDLIILSSMVNLVEFKKNHSFNTPHVIYFHENQVAYPWTSNGRSNKSSLYIDIQKESAKIADYLIFNSEFNRNSFSFYLDKSFVLPIGLNLDIYRKNRASKNAKLTFLWNHRWEYDKGPDLFFKVLKDIKKKYDFNLIILGESPHHVINQEFIKAKDDFKDNIIHMGYAESFDKYIQLLWNSHIALNTSKHDFFGISVCEAIACEVIPILPKRLAYPEHFLDDKVFYSEQSQILDKIQLAINGKIQINSKIKDYDWKILIRAYKEVFEKMRESFKPSLKI